ncbi:MAG: hypothetical protein GY882_01615 [Actinomycetia bacterium]|nr:hypothetical protein [Actinomycetes bacterium]MCP4844867.1 hypothetical protein [Actinomycetes bacterium]
MSANALRQRRFHIDDPDLGFTGYACAWLLALASRVAMFAAAAVCVWIWVAAVGHFALHQPDGVPTQAEAVST